MRALVSTILSAAFAVASAGRAQQPLPPSCDAKLAKAAAGRDTTTYRVRGTTVKWCEGVLVRQEVGNIELKLQAFTRVTPSVTAAALRRIDTLLVQWTAPPGMIVHILARQATDPLADYYQLDVEVPTPASGDGSWSWPVAVLKGARMWPIALADSGAERPPAISVQAVGRMTNGSPDSVYVPVRIVPRRAMSTTTPGATSGRASGTGSGTASGSTSGTTSAASPPAPARFLITMTAKERVTVKRPSLFRVAADSSTTPVTMARCPAITGGLVGGDPVTIPVCMPAGAPSGIYVVVLSASSDAAMLRTAGIRFYYDAPTP